MVWRAVMCGLMRSVRLEHSLKREWKSGCGGGCVMVRDAQSGRRLLLLDASDGDAQRKSEALSFGFGDGGRGCTRLRLGGTVLEQRGWKAE